MRENGDGCQPAVLRYWKSEAGKLESFQWIKLHLPTNLKLHIHRHTNQSAFHSVALITYYTSVRTSGKKELLVITQSPRERPVEREDFASISLHEGGCLHRSYPHITLFNTDRPKISHPPLSASFISFTAP